ALSVNFNSVTVVTMPGQAGGSAVVAIEPPIPYFKLSNKAVTTSTGGRKVSVSVIRRGDHEEVEVTGKVPARDPGKSWYRRAQNPPLYAANLIMETLKLQGIEVAGKPGVKAAQKDAVMVHTFFSEPLAVIVRDMNKLSNNFTAEQVLKVLGGTKKEPAGFDAGLEIMYALLERAGVPRGSCEITNGSGLSHRTRLSGEQIVKVLAYAWRKFAWAPDYVSSLSIATGDGTVRKRYRGTSLEHQLRAKTGSIDMVASLSGYLQNASGDPVAFAVIANGFDDRHYRDVANIEDAMAVVLSETR
ncbi:MAG: D-alanyl-D-alanine carboxypeptidase/D-alanyl-D-alanine-endopeptidase, partial [Myxococcota bacterium]